MHADISSSNRTGALEAGVTRLQHVFARVWAHMRRSDGFITSEMIAGAVLSVGLLVAVFAVLQALGVDTVNWMRGQLGI